MLEDQSAERRPAESVAEREVLHRYAASEGNTE